ncbi:MAG: bifunctional (p)ppGpp synthetase/guanosine-3',5'-bis(diphosphate) 3'-pyrophosphohydrolase [Clostridia bacterium]|nr:bifunctional (p)ppGpp synthetase/guanosine-3',5'-bis(diphosphate) 3'-pyrophosphohydrolase [Clostridia bacterium]
MNLEQYITIIERYNPNIDTAEVVRAYNYAEQAHRGQFRKSGEPYFIHPVEVSLILAELEMDVHTIIASLLHDVVEDTDTTCEEIEMHFGKDVALLVDGVTKLGKIHYESKEERQAENLRKMLLAMAKDVRVILIKLADRLHNMRTLKFMTDAKKKEKAAETLEIYAPIAHRLGIFRVKWELEDLALLYMEPEKYYDLVNRVNKKRDQRLDYITSVIEKLRDAIDEVNIKCEIYGRPKNFYSIYKKMYVQHKSFEEIYDLTAVRILVDSVKDCYGALGVVHTMWTPLPGRFKDYIATPKPNMYQSLHTTLIGDQGEPFEIQIRTYEMHRIAEYGIAAHWKYKEGENAANNSADMDSKLSWLRQMMELQGDLKDPQEFMESLRIDLFNNQVYVFTPDGEVVELPVGSTPVDFAYKIHSAVGNKCVGAKVNNRIVPLNYQLKNGQLIEIMTSKTANGPSRDWLKFVQTTQAKNRIKHWFKKERREENVSNGRDMLERDIRRAGYQPSQLLRPEWVKPLIERFNMSTMDDIYAAIGYGGILLAQVTPKLKDLYKQEQRERELAKEAASNTTSNVSEIPNFKEDKHSKRQYSSDGVTVKGTDNLLVRFAKCCNPVPGDEIIGFITRGRGVTIHRADCNNFERNDDTPNRFIEVAWNTEKDQTFTTDIQIIAPDRKGLLGEVTILIGEANLTVTGVNAKITKNGVAIINLTIEIPNIDQLDKVINKIRSMPDVIEVKRVKG